jgi:PD-(D/E)XK endonuclease
VPDRKLRLPRPKLTDHPVDVGHRTEAAIQLELLRRGYRVLVPLGVNQRYDLVLDTGDGFVRAQCKTGRLRDGCVVFRTASVQSNTRRSRVRDYAGGADVFLVYSPETRAVYVVPVAEASRSQMLLRVDRSRNAQAQGVHWATDYELPA